MVKSTLKPCPFCGNRDVFIVDSASQLVDEWGEDGWGQGEMLAQLRRFPSYAVCCPANEGGCGAVGGWHLVEEWAITLWNRRME